MEYTDDFEVKPVVEHSHQHKIACPHIIQADTDSNYLNLDPLLKKMGKVDDFHFMIKLYDKEIEPVIKAAIDEVSHCLNFMEKTINYEREKITQGFVSMAPKRYYFLNRVTNKVLEEPYLDQTGVSAIGKSTPPAAKKILKQVMPEILKGNQSELEKFVFSQKEKYGDNDLLDICEVKSVSDVTSWFLDEETGKVKKFKDDGVTLQTAQAHIRGAFIHNMLMKEQGLDNDYDLIENKDKPYVTFVHPQEEHFNTDTIAFKNREVFQKLNFFVDSERMFDKHVLKNIDLLVRPMGWIIRNHEEGLDAFF